ncbi:MAG TPA: type I-C CRISPR-associated protein Cas8c/Csd1 [Elusimicrobiales bacterium]|nr:type I-C CRISPR-associated protein Cas8c/Csd1 [Elusimicrobiales bacterium]
MILQALKEYYDRKAALPDSKMAPEGFEWKEIPFIIVLNKEGHFVNIENTYEGDGKDRRAKSFLLPHSEKKGVNIVANLFWGTPEYALGWVRESGKPGRIKKMHEAFIKRISGLGKIEDDGYRAVCCFLETSNKEKLLATIESNPAVRETLKELVETGRNLSFKLAGDAGLIPERKAVFEAIKNSLTNSTNGVRRRCLVTGTIDTLTLTHAAIKGVWGAQPTGGNIVSFNFPAACSYGKSQGENAPVGKTAVSSYTTALNYLLGKDSRQRIQAGDSTVVFWSKKSSKLEDDFFDFFSIPPKDDPERGARAVEALLRSVENGAFISDETSDEFYVLALAPNAARLSVRFWIKGPVSAMAEKIARHFKDIQIVHGPKDGPVLPLFRLLVSIASLGKAENIPPNLAGDTMRAILEGLPYPRTLLQAAVRRVRAEHEVTYPRAALIKAAINRFARYQDPENKEELKVSLDLENKNAGYRLGRLFAALEKVQSEANPGINATIRDRFYGAASSTPVTVFGNLMRLKNHHLAKLENPGRKVYFEKLLSEIAGELPSTGFPSHLALDDQGRFAIGYYHQMQDFYTKKSE